MPPKFTQCPAALAVLLLLAACGRQQTPPAGSPPQAEDRAQAEQAVDEGALHRDAHSFANIEDFVTEHLLLDLSLDFTRRQIAGVAELQLRRLNPDAHELVLDTRGLSIDKVEAKLSDGGWQTVDHALGRSDPMLGTPLAIRMPAAAQAVRVHYTTSPRASGLQWLSPEQTADGEKPFLFTQSQAIHARSWVPLQDTPSVRATFEAKVHAPPGILAVMGAQNEAGAEADGEYSFRMPQPIPSYLLALAAGDLRFAALGERTGIYAEPSVIEAAAHEFEDTQAMLEQAEKLYGPYRWGRYDLLILPPSFPYGGMENPRLTFATPTVIAGDKSLVSLVAHELAHSWSGNLVTNATWRDFWLNEGFTTYFTTRIMEAVYGGERADMERVLETQALLRMIETVPPEQRMLAADVRGKDPDEAVGPIAYDRGALFLYNLEKAFGREKFDAFLKAWFDEHAFTSQNTEAFVAFLDERLISPNPGVFSLQLAKAWIYEPAIPESAVYPASAAFEEVDTARREWLAGQRAADQLGAGSWNVLHWTHFIENLPQDIGAERVAELDRVYRFTQSGNRVLLRAWLPVAIRADYAPAYPAVERHLTTVGRMYLLSPIYKALMQTEKGQAFARRVYARARPAYHPIAQAAMDRIVEPDEAS